MYKGARLAGQIRRTDSGNEFTYKHEYIQERLPAVSFTLPPRSAPYHASSGAIPAFFAGLLPEGMRLQAVITAVKTSADDELSLLLAVGDDPIGDVRVVPEGDQIAEDERVVTSADPSTESFRELFEISIDPMGDLDKAIPGVQNKISDAVISFHLTGRKGPSILKLSPDAFPLLVENEAFFLSLARTAGLNVPRFEVMTDRDSESGLLVERFDREFTDNGFLIRFGQEDGCQLLGKWPADKYRVALSDVVKVFMEAASAPKHAVLDLVLQYSFGYLIGNGDLHAKNLSLRWTDAEQLVAPTPAYDLLSTIPYPLDTRMAMKIDGRDDRIRGSYVISFGERFGLPSKLVRRRLGELLERSEPNLQYLEDIGYDAPTTERLEREIRHRLGELRRFA